MIPKDISMQLKSLRVRVRRLEKLSGIGRILAPAPPAVESTSYETDFATGATITRHRLSAFVTELPSTDRLGFSVQVPIVADPANQKIFRDWILAKVKASLDEIWKEEK